MSFRFLKKFAYKKARGGGGGSYTTLHVVNIYGVATYFNFEPGLKLTGKLMRNGEWSKKKFGCLSFLGVIATTLISYRRK